MLVPTDQAVVDTVADPRRLAALAATGLLDTPPEESFDRLTRLAAAVLDAPVALVSLVDDTRQFFKSQVGLTGAVAARRGSPLEQAYCKTVVERAAPLVVSDAPNDPAWADHPGTRLGVVAYLGTPLITHGGHTLGTFCAVDFRPRAWSGRELAVVRELSALAVSEIELRLVARGLQQDYLDLRTLQLARDDTAQMLVHDLRNPLTSVIGGLDLLQTEGSLSLRQQQYIRLAVQGAESLVNLVSAVLDAQKAESGKLGLALKQQPPVALAEAAARQVSGAAAARGVQLVLDLPAGLPPVLADADKVRRVFVNLLANAVQHTPAGGSVRIGGRTGRGSGPVRRGRHRQRHPGRHLRPALPAVRGGRHDLPGQGVHRPRAGLLPGRDRGPRRSHLGRERHRPGHQLLVHAAGAGLIVRRPHPEEDLSFVDNWGEAATLTSRLTVGMRAP